MSSLDSCKPGFMSLSILRVCCATHIVLQTNADQHTPSHIQYIQACSTDQRHHCSHVRQKLKYSFDAQCTYAPLLCRHVANPPPFPSTDTLSDLSIPPVPLGFLRDAFATAQNNCSQITNRSSALRPKTSLSLLLHFCGFHLIIGGTLATSQMMETAGSRNPPPPCHKRRSKFAAQHRSNRRKCITPQSTPVDASRRQSTSAPFDRPKGRVRCLWPPVIVDTV
jgi:hypothetical protein